MTAADTVPGAPAPAAECVPPGQRRRPLPAWLGADVWTLPSLGWCNLRGKPQRAPVRFTVPLQAPQPLAAESILPLVQTLAASAFADAQDVRQHLRAALNALAWGEQTVGSSVGVQWLDPQDLPQAHGTWPDGLSLDRLELECPHTQPEASLLTAHWDQAPVTEVLTSRLLAARCPQTGRLRWASLRLEVFGAPIHQAGLLQYLVSLRHAAQAPQPLIQRLCVDVWQRCRPHQLSVLACFAEQDGLGLSVLRSSAAGPMPQPPRA